MAPLLRLLLRPRSPVDDGPRPSPSWHRRRVPTRPVPSSYAGGTRAQLDCPDAWTGPVVAALTAAGVVLDRSAPVGIAVTPARLVSATVDAWCVDSLPHVLVGVQPYAVDVGPWVAPGVGPCARCVAAAVLDEGDRAAPGAVPRPLLALAAGAVARDLAAWSRERAAAHVAHVVARRPRAGAGRATLAAPPLLRVRLVRRGVRRRLIGSGHHHSLSSLLSIARRWVREQVSQ